MCAESHTENISKCTCVIHLEAWFSYVPFSGLNIMWISCSITLYECESVFAQCLSWELGPYRRSRSFGWKCVKPAFYWRSGRSWKHSSAACTDLRLKKLVALQTYRRLWENQQLDCLIGLMVGVYILKTSLVLIQYMYTSSSKAFFKV